ncbi:MAG: hypothetical protein HXX08_05060 [Chloroflexi bacterium]|uniref:Uncharacterized protein n=1 Tax=Candidatus Chlorohelix allophototropha TaxID=3003348 RepID=A0A8T7LY70_9CHLR|nr:hypothetical protein [Chloroflexota bacterium]WJW67109.1 hypothetical protein OZ401_000360 [Chloroflexota bacterium L227-S17]
MAAVLSPNKHEIEHGEYVVELVGEFDYYLMDWFKVLDANCARVVERTDGFYVVPFGRINGSNYEEDAIGPFTTQSEAREEAEAILEADE